MVQTTRWQLLLLMLQAFFFRLSAFIATIRILIIQITRVWPHKGEQASA